MMRETFGYNKDLKALVRSALIERNLVLAKNQADAKKLLGSSINFGVEHDDSIKSIDQPLIARNNINISASIDDMNGSMPGPLNKTTD